MYLYAKQKFTLLKNSNKKFIRDLKYDIET
jgi:hypothetical protein